MSGTGIFYTISQQTAMQAAITAAQAAQSENNPQGVISALNNYYSVQVYKPGTQTVIRGYAIAAIQVLNDTESGVVANNDVKNAVGQATYTPEYQANLAI